MQMILMLIYLMKPANLLKRIMEQKYQKTMKFLMRSHFTQEIRRKVKLKLMFQII